MRLAGAAFAAAVAAAAVAGAQSLPPPGNERYVSYFDIVAFGSEVPGQETTIVNKWTGPVRYKLGGRTGAIVQYRPVIERHLETLHTFSDVRFEEIGAQEPGEQMIV